MHIYTFFLNINNYRNEILFGIKSEMFTQRIYICASAVYVCKSEKVIIVEKLDCIR